MRNAAKPWVNTQALIPERSGVGNLRHRAPEEDGGEISDPTDMAQRLQDQCGRLSTTSRAAIDTDVGTAAQKRGLRSGLRRDLCREWKCHASRLKRRGCALRSASKVAILRSRAIDQGA